MLIEKIAEHANRGAVKLTTTAARRSERLFLLKLLRLYIGLLREHDLTPTEIYQLIECWADRREEGYRNREIL